MSDIKEREDKIRAKRMQTPWRDFVKEIGSWQPLNVYKHPNGMSRFPITGREPKLLGPKEFVTNISTVELGDDFFASLTQLYKEQEQMMLMQWFDNENCDFAESYGGKNCYLSFSVGGGAENLLYDFICANNIRNVHNCLAVFENSDNVYRSRVVTHSYNVFYSSNILQSNNIWFCVNLVGCAECISCSGLENQSYCIENVVYSKEEYQIKKNEILSKKKDFEQKYLEIIEVKIDNKLCKNCIGSGLISCTDVQDGYIGTKISQGRNFIIAGGEEEGKNFYDCFDVGFQSENYDFYGVHYCGEGAHHIYCSSSISKCSHVFYSYFLENCSYCLGCVGLKNKSFCIFNKEYSKEEWLKIADDIFQKMSDDGTLGQFFPGTMNPFYFNDTVASLIDESFTKEEVMKEGYLRRDEEINVDVPMNANVITAKDFSKYQGFVNGREWKINPEILKKVIRDEKGNFYKIVPMELEFLQKYGLPLPEIHWLERIKLGFKFK